jgi:hypothetical protein
LCPPISTRATSSTVHNGGSRAEPSARTPHHHALSCFPAYNLQKRKAKGHGVG